jgi:DHA2 family multidrug resistance protein
MQEMLGLTATTSGLAMMPRTLVMVVVMPLVGKYYNRFPPALVAAVGLVLAMVGQYSLSGLTLDSTDHDVLVGIVLQGIGISFMLVPLQTLSFSTIPRTRLADATGLSSLIRQVGGSLGLAGMSTLLSRYGVEATESLKWQVSADRPEVAARLMHAPSPLGAIASMTGSVMRQGMVLGFDKTFALGAALFLLAAPLILLLRSPPAASGAGAAHTPHIEIE